MYEEYHTLKHTANLYYSSMLSSQLESSFFFYLDPLKWKLKKIDVIPFISKVKSLIMTIRKYKNMALLYDNDLIGPLLYPNMKINSSPMKSELANKVGELTMLWGVTLKSKQLAYKQQIYSWKDPQFKSEIIGFKNEKKKILDAILDINRSKSSDKWILIPSNYSYSNLFKQKFSNQVFLDFEYTSEYLYLIGIIYQNKYYAYWAANLSKENELNLLKQFNIFLKSLPMNINVWYWYAEKNKYEKKCKEYDLEIIDDNWIDFCQILKKGPIAFKYAFDYKLKSIIHSLYKNNKITYQYKDLECTNGLESIEIAHSYYLTRDNTLKQEIEKYNQMDCQGMKDLFNIIRSQLRN